MKKSFVLSGCLFAMMASSAPVWSDDDIDPNPKFSGVWIEEEMEEIAYVITQKGEVFEVKAGAGNESEWVECSFVTGYKDGSKTMLKEAEADVCELHEMDDDGNETKKPHEKTPLGEMHIRKSDGALLEKYCNDEGGCGYMVFHRGDD